MPEHTISESTRIFTSASKEERRWMKRVDRALQQDKMELCCTLLSNESCQLPAAFLEATLEQCIVSKVEKKSSYPVSHLLLEQLNREKQFDLASTQALPQFTTFLKDPAKKSDYLRFADHLFQRTQHRTRYFFLFLMLTVYSTDIKHSIKRVIKPLLLLPKPHIEQAIILCCDHAIDTKNPTLLMHLFGALDTTAYDPRPLLAASYFKKKYHNNDDILGLSTMILHCDQLHVVASPSACSYFLRQSIDHGDSSLLRHY